MFFEEKKKGYFKFFCCFIWCDVVLFIGFRNFYKKKEKKINVEEERKNIRYYFKI